MIPTVGHHSQPHTSKIKGADLRSEVASLDGPRDGRLDQSDPR